MSTDLADVRRGLPTQGIDMLRLIFPDIIGMARSKDVMVSPLELPMVWIDYSQVGMTSFSICAVAGPPSSA